MKPAPFRYHRPASLDEAIALMADHAGDARPLAGGQSLVPAMNFRLAQPAILIDLNRVAGLGGITEDAGGLHIGAMTRHATLERSPDVRRLAPLVADALPFVAHPPIRTRSTIGGSLAHADAAAELPAVALALDAEVTATSRRGARRIAAADLFLGLYSTALDPDELLTAVHVPAPPPGLGVAFDEISRRHGDYALAGAAAAVALDTAGRPAHVRLALLGAGDRPLAATAAARILEGEIPTAEAVRAAAAAAAADDADPFDDIHASAAYRRHLVGLLAERVLTRAIARARAAAGPE